MRTESPRRCARLQSKNRSPLRAFALDTPLSSALASLSSRLRLPRSQHQLQSLLALALSMSAHDYGDEELARQLQAEELAAQQEMEDKYRAGQASAVSAAAAAGASSSHSREKLDQMTKESAPIVILQRQVGELLSAGPHPDIIQLFRLYNAALFGNALGGVQVDWSNRMKLCAGQCSFKPAAGHCRIALSAPLLQYRPTSDLLCTLLHEMIHAMLFVGPRRTTDRDDHGPNFQEHMYRINRLLGLNIT